MSPVLSVGVMLQAAFRHMVHAMLIIIPMLFFGMVSFLVLNTLYDDEMNTVRCALLLFMPVAFLPFL